MVRLLHAWEYANVVWDPHQQYLIDNIEMVQWQAARWVKQDYRLTSSVSDMIEDLGWPTLSIGLTNVVYAVALTDGSHLYNVHFTKFMSYLPY